MGVRRLATGQTGHLTRRTLLSGAVSAGAASLLLPQVTRAAGAERRSSVFALSLGSLVGVTPTIEAGRSFALVGVQWSAPAHAHVELRARDANGGWSPWVPASTVGHDGDGQLAGRLQFGEPMWTGTANAIQLRSERRVSGVWVHFVAARGGVGAAHAPADGARAAALPLASPVLAAGPGQPPIIARQAWAQGRARPRNLPEYGSIRVAFVHHTVSPNGYGPGEVPAMLRAIFDYHVHVRGWWDIGYNFLVDAFGRIWEGRAGGIDMAVVGAQAGAYNTESTGVAMLGDFTAAVPSPAATGALEHLLAWKLALHGVPALGRTTVVVDPADAFYTRFRPGAHVSLPRIAGHRDGDLTDCPGNALYGELPALRPRVSALAGDPVRVTVAPQTAQITAGAAATLSGALTLLSGQALGGAPVELQQLGQIGPPAVTFLEVTTAPDGTWSASLTPTQNALVRALHRPGPAGVSDWSLIAVAPAITLNAQSVSPLIVTGTVSPAKPHVIVDLYRGSSAAGKPIRKKRIAVAGGSFTAQLSVPGPGNYVVVARTKADVNNVAGSSAPLAVAVS